MEYDVCLREVHAAYGEYTASLPSFRCCCFMASQYRYRSDHDRNQEYHITALGTRCRDIDAVRDMVITNAALIYGR